jgi:hypothetical protein
MDDTDWSSWKRGKWMIRKNEPAQAERMPDKTIVPVPQEASPLTTRQQHILQTQQSHGNQHTLQHLGMVQRIEDTYRDPELIEIRERIEEEARQRREQYNNATATPLRTLDDLLNLIRRAEAAYPGDDWRGITTRIRKSYYDGFLWDSMIADRSSYPGLSWPPMALEDYKAFTEAKRNPELQINGQSVDIGHVFTGLDAMNFQNTGTVMWAAGVQGPPGATWAGDVGSALAMWDLEVGTGDRNRRQEYYDRYASSDDMLGDVDGIAASLMPAGGEAAMGGNKLSDRLSWYYRGFNGSGGGASMRFTNFCRAAGFTWTGRGSGITFNSGSRTTIRTQVNNFGQAFRLRNGGYPGANWFRDQDIDWFTDQFIAWVVQGLARENP